MIKEHDNCCTFLARVSNRLYDPIPRLQSEDCSWRLDRAVWNAKLTHIQIFIPIFKYLDLGTNHLYLASNHLYLGINDLKIGINDLYLGSNDLFISSNTTIYT